MTGITDLPLELVLAIIEEYLTPDIPSIYSDAYLMSRATIINRWWARPSIFDEGEMANPHSPNNDVVMSEPNAYSTLRALRLTHRYFNELCTPLVYAELDILPQRAAMDNASAAISHYGQHVRRLGIIVVDQTHENPQNEAYNSLILEALGACSSTTSLALHFDQGNALPYTASFQAFMTGISDMVTLLATQGPLSSLGICSLPVVRRYRASDNLPHPGIATILDPLVPLLSRTPSLRHLEISCESIGTELYKSIRLNAGRMRSITFGACLTSDLIKIWGFGRDGNWASSNNLTHLRLIQCYNVYPPDIPELVNHFSSLRHLLLAFCGDEQDPLPSSRKTGWSREPDALWRQRQPLDTLHMEHMIKWEIMIMGTIPTKEMIVTAIPIVDLAICFNKDPELFPCLNLLRTQLPPAKGIRDGPTKEAVDPNQWLSSLLGGRGVSRKEDAERLVNSHWSFS